MFYARLGRSGSQLTSYATHFSLLFYVFHRLSRQPNCQQAVPHLWSGDTGAFFFGEAVILYTKDSFRRLLETLYELGGLRQL